MTPKIGLAAYYNSLNSVRGFALAPHHYPIVAGLEDDRIENFLVLGPPGLGTTTLRQDAAKAVTAAMKDKGAKKLVWLSAFGVGENMAQARRTSFLATLFMKLVLARTYVDADAAEHVLRGSDLDYVICRPPELRNRAARGHVDEVPEDRKLPRISIPRADVAAWMLKAASEDRYARQAVTIC